MAENPVAVITGATKGLGRAMAERFVREGFDIVACARSEADLFELRTSLESAAANRVHTLAADFGKKEDVAAFARFVEKTAPSTAVLINNAGVYLPGNVSDEPDGRLEKLLQVNLLSAYELTRSLLAARPPRHVFNICSVASLMAYPGGGSYSISKFALLGFSKNLREELKPRGIKVTAVLPGATWSDSWRGVELPEERLMQARDIADMVWAAFNLSPSAVVEDIVLRPQLGDL